MYVFRPSLVVMVGCQVQAEVQIDLLLVRARYALQTRMLDLILPS